MDDQDTVSGRELSRMPMNWIFFPLDDTGIIMDLLDYNDCLEIEDVGRISLTSCWTARRPG